MAAKTENYTTEMESILSAEYKASPTKETVEKLAVKFGKTSRSIVAKLSRMGIYQKAEYVSKSGEPVTRKSELANRLMEKFGLTEAEATSLEKANKTALLKILEA